MRKGRLQRGDDATPASEAVVFASLFVQLLRRQTEILVAKHRFPSTLKRAVWHIFVHYRSCFPADDHGEEEAEEPEGGEQRLSWMRACLHARFAFRKQRSEAKRPQTQKILGARLQVRFSLHFIYLALVFLRLPILVRELLELAQSNAIPLRDAHEYLSDRSKEKMESASGERNGDNNDDDAADDNIVPEHLRKHFDAHENAAAFHKSKYLRDRFSPSVPSRDQFVLEVSALAEFMERRSSLVLPEINVPLLTHRILQEAALVPAAGDRDEGGQAAKVLDLTLRLMAQAPQFRDISRRWGQYGAQRAQRRERTSGFMQNHFDPEEKLAGTAVFLVRLLAQVALRNVRDPNFIMWLRDRELGIERGATVLAIPVRCGSF